MCFKFLPCCFTSTRQRASSLDSTDSSDNQGMAIPRNVLHSTAEVETNIATPNRWQRFKERVVRGWQRFASLFCCYQRAESEDQPVAESISEDLTPQEIQCIREFDLPIENSPITPLARSYCLQHGLTSDCLASVQAVFSSMKLTAKVKGNKSISTILTKLPPPQELYLHHFSDYQDKHILSHTGAVLSVSNQTGLHMNVQNDHSSPYQRNVDTKVLFRQSAGLSAFASIDKKTSFKSDPRHNMRSTLTLNTVLKSGGKIYLGTDKLKKKPSENTVNVFVHLPMNQSVRVIFSARVKR